MNHSQLSLRELKKARSKLALYNSFLSLLGDKVFRDLLLDDICRAAEVSRVTFFNFFEKKEDLLVYFMRIWLSERIIEIQQRRMRGFAAVRHLLHKVAEQHGERPGLMPSLISFLAEMKMHPCMPELSTAEVQLLFPGEEEMGAKSPDMYELFHQCVLEAELDGQLRQDLQVDTAVKVLFTVFYGAFLTAQLYSSSAVMDFYETHLQMLEK